MVRYRDPIHGDMHFSGALERIIDTDEFQRLGEVMQLGLTHKVYTSATHTRLAHSIGAAYLAGEMAKQLCVPDEDRLLIQLAALLHDVGHTDFSHALEGFLKTGHEQNGFDIILGLTKLPGRTSGAIAAMCTSAGINPNEVIDIIRGTSGKPPFYHSIISHAIFDVDRMDFLMRDAYHTGLKNGIDVSRIKHKSVVHPETLELGIEERGIDDVEDLLYVRARMYKKVYRHETVFAAEVMLRKAVSDSIEVAVPFLYGDGALLTRLSASYSESTRELVRRLRRGKHAFHTAAYTVTTASASEDRERAQRVQDCFTVASLERYILEETGVRSYDAIVTYGKEAKSKPAPTLPVLCEDGSWKDFYDVSDLGRMIASKERERTLLTVHTAPEIDDCVKNRVIAAVNSI